MPEKTISSALIIDDNQVYVYTFKKLSQLRNLCSNLMGFYYAGEAITFLADPANRENLPDVIFLDIYMPQMDGWEFLYAFREIKPQLGKNIIIFMVTSSINHLDMERAKTFPEIIEYFVKPSNEQEMTAIYKKAAESVSALSSIL